MRCFLLPLLCAPLLALAQTPTPRQIYTCDNGSRIDISFNTAADGRPIATLHFADGAVTLPQVPAASGALYRTEDIRLHTKDSEAIFEDGKGNARHCIQGSNPPPGATTAQSAVSSFIDITGSVTYRIRIALPPDAVLIVRVQDTARAGAPARTLAEQRIELAGQQVPINFQTTIDRDLIGKKARVTVSARIEHQGKLLFISDRIYPALTNGQPTPVEIQMKQAGNGKAR